VGRFESGFTYYFYLGSLSHRSAIPQVLISYVLENGLLQLSTLFLFHRHRYRSRIQKSSDNLHCKRETHLESRLQIMTGQNSSRELKQRYRNSKGAPNSWIRCREWFHLRVSRTRCIPVKFPHCFSSIIPCPKSKDSKFNLSIYFLIFIIPKNCPSNL